MSGEWQLLGGTWRKSDPRETIERLRPLLPFFGISRVANVTGLDRLGLDVFVAIRPNSKFLSVSQGKGVSEELAWISAVMESIESWHVENLREPEDHLTFKQIAERGMDAKKPEELAEAPFAKVDFESTKIGWYRAENVVNSKPIYIPALSVSLDMRYPKSLQAFHGVSTNGLAAGNDYEEACCHALYEVIERASVKKWRSLPESARRATQVSMESVREAGVKKLIQALSYSASSLEIYEATDPDIGVPVFCVNVFPSDTDSLWCQRGYSGSGAHLDSRVALSRAITEAVQSRLSMISGAREDNFPEDYFSDIAPVYGDGGERVFESKDFSADSQFSDVLSRLKNIGHDEIIILNCSRPDVAIPVVKVFVPCLGCK